MSIRQDLRPERKNAMVTNIRDDIVKVQALGLLDRLLTDKTTKRRIMWAADDYAGLGFRYGRNEQMAPELITGVHAGVLEIRARKETELLRQCGEPVSPRWLCKKLCDYVDFRPTDWQRYVDSRVLELTCGEAPFLASRYDVRTGAYIPIPDRFGLLDRKLRAVNENVQDEELWLNWAFRALGATYGYEFRGDRLLIARINLLMTFTEYLWDRWKREPTPSEYGKVINIITWNLWQMDGLKGTIPYGTAEEEFQQLDLFTCPDADAVSDTGGDQPPCRVCNWTGGGSAEYLALPVTGKHAMKFALVIGCPPYREEIAAGRKSVVPSSYPPIMDRAYQISERVVLIHPARFLIDTWNAPKAWKESLLRDPHLKVLWYEADSQNVFPGTRIPGGVTITYWDSTREFRRADTFAVFPELNTIWEKVSSQEADSLMDIVHEPPSFRLAALCAEHPEYLAIIGNDERFRNDAFAGLPVFAKAKTDVSDLAVIGIVGGKREWRYFPQKYVQSNSENLRKYKVLLSVANGASGTLGKAPVRLMTKPFLGIPDTAATQSFLSFGAFETEAEAGACLKYMKSRFARTMLGVLKTSQDINRETWKYVPLQNFTAASDIDWSKSIPEIDRQLYEKYGLSEREIRFIDSHVKEML